MNFSNMDLSHGQQSFMNCSCAGPFQVVYPSETGKSLDWCPEHSSRSQSAVTSVSVHTYSSHICSLLSSIILYPLLNMFSQSTTNIAEELSLGRWCVHLGARNWLCPTWQKLLTSSHRSPPCSTPHHTLPNPCHVNPVQLDNCAGILSYDTKVKEFLHIGANTLQEVAVQNGKGKGS